MIKNILGILMLGFGVSFVAVAHEQINHETTSTSEELYAPVEYVKICSLYGAQFFYVPGTDQCLNALTGDLREQTEEGTVRGESPMALRIRWLEDRVALLEQALLPPKQTQEVNTAAE
jgi:hypothetical protein